MAFRYKGQMTLALGATFAAVSFQLYIPQLLGNSVDAAWSLFQRGAGAEEARRALMVYASLLFGTSVLRGLFTMLHNYQGEAVGQSVGYELRLAIYEKIQRLSFSYHDRVHSGDLITPGQTHLDLEEHLFEIRLVPSGK